MNTTRIDVLDHGFVEFLDCMGDDFTPAQDARISTGSEAKDENADRILTRFLLRHKHSTPFEGVILKFKVKAPIMVFREWHRHRTQSFNEVSGRYRQLDPEYYLPEPSRIKKQSTTNKQGSGEEFDFHDQTSILENWKIHQEEFEIDYCKLINNNVANELARLEMPVSHYSEMIVTANLLNWFRFLQLRMASAAQFEIRQYANAIGELIKERFPICWSAFEDYWLNAITFSAKELQALARTDIDWLLSEHAEENLISLKGRELQEFKDKILRIKPDTATYYALIE